jgi:hypothetical protein
MKRLALFAALSLLSAEALAVGRLADVNVLDRDTGRVLPTYYHRGEYWVAGTPGERYAISVHNRQGTRVLAVMAVDGVNVISGETAGWDQSGYVFGAEERYDITGWRKSNAEVAAFRFAAAPDSYAARTGRAANVGVIGIAVFRERVEPVLSYSEPPRPAAAESRTAGAPVTMDLPTVVGPPTAADAARNQAPIASAPRSSPLGTAHGERESSYSTTVQFTRQRNTPDELIRIRYDSRENLVALGVIRTQPVVPPGPNPFPGSPQQGFVPDPPAYPGVGLR